MKRINYSKNLEMWLRLGKFFEYLPWLEYKSLKFEFVSTIQTRAGQKRFKKLIDEELKKEMSHADRRELSDIYYKLRTLR